MKTLVLVHKTFLQDQWIDRAKFFTTATLGIIRQNKIDTDKDIVIGMLQSISQKDYDENIFKDFGFVIVDECHDIASRVFSRALYKTGSEYTLGLSATPKRLDGLTKVLYWYLGNMLYQEEREQDNKIIVRKVNFTSYDPLFIEKKLWTKGKKVPFIPSMITNLTQIKRRNTILINIINTLRKNSKRKILVLSNRIAHLEYIKQECDVYIQQDIENDKILKDECPTYLYVGKTKPEERKSAELYGSVLFSSYSMSAEGLDIDRLNTVVLATPIKNITQSIGRIMRKVLTTADMAPLIVDIADDLSVFSHQGDGRMKVYKKSGYCVKEIFANDEFQVSSKSYHNSGGKYLENDHMKIKQIFSDDELNNFDTTGEVEIKKEKFHTDITEVFKDFDFD